MALESSPATYAYPAAQRLSGSTIAIIVAAHVGVLALLASLDVLPLPPQLTTLMVHIVAAPPAAQVAPPRPAAPPRVENKPIVRPKPAAATPVSRQLAAQSDAPGATAEAAPAAPAPSAAASSASTSSTNSANASPTVSAPRFDAGYLSNPAPSYPSLSRKLGEEGKVVLRVLVDAGGRASRIEIKNSSAWPRLDQAAQDAVARWKFIPARRGDEAVDAWVLVPIVFNLRS